MAAYSGSKKISTNVSYWNLDRAGFDNERAFYAGPGHNNVVSLLSLDHKSFQFEYPDQHLEVHRDDSL